MGVDNIGRIPSGWSGKKAIQLNRTLSGSQILRAKRSGNGINVTWTRNTKVQGYQLQFADNIRFLKAKSASVASSRKTSFTRYGLTAGMGWYARIRTFQTADNGERYYSEWSDPVYLIR